MARILAPILAHILLLLGWKKTVVFANLKATRNWVGWKGNPPDPNTFYFDLIQSMSLDLLQFLFGFQNIQVLISPASEEILDQMKNGGLLLTAHLGNWELLGSTLRTRGIPLIATFQPFPHRLSNRLLAWIRSRNGNRVERLEDSLFSIRNHFRNGNLFTFLGDQDYRSEDTPSSFPPITFLGIEVRYNPLPFRLLKLFPNTVCFFAVGRPVKSRLYCIDAIQAHPNSTCDSISRRYNEWLESEIAQNPLTWSGWTHRRFLSTKPTIYSQN